SQILNLPFHTQSQVIFILAFRFVNPGKGIRRILRKITAAASGINDPAAIYAVVLVFLPCKKRSGGIEINLKYFIL
ncbi:MAG: hypothetical protein MI892_05245, partial [Desulfobacterales bacterium]|nr:hypothetical protein [Desulfobacterales bacterium]